MADVNRVGLLGVAGLYSNFRSIVIIQPVFGLAQLGVDVRVSVRDIEHLTYRVAILATLVVGTEVEIVNTTLQAADVDGQHGIRHIAGARLLAGIIIVEPIFIALQWRSGILLEG